MWHIHPFSVLSFIDFFLYYLLMVLEICIARQIDLYIFPFLSFPWICWTQKEISNIFPFNYYWKSTVKDKFYFWKFWKNLLVKTLRPIAVCEEVLSRWFAVGVFKFHFSCFCQFWQIMIFVIASHLSVIGMEFFIISSCYCSRSL
jgi:hypothetical protein